MKILLYVEPHPIRDSFEEFSGIGTFLAEAMLNEKTTTAFDLRILSNNAVLDIICGKLPNAAMICERPSGAESKQIEDYKSAWSKKNIDTWIDLTKAAGPATDLYISILDRIYKKYQFDAVVLWSENGAVRKFCEDKGIVVLHGELGPTRAPFEETIYFDPAGTNGNASARKVNLQSLSLKNLPPETWLGQKSRYENNPDGIGIIDAPYTAVPDDVSQLVKFPYIFVPLQLADDLNTIKNSIFEGPVDFLEKILPAFIDQGYTVVIKPHPGSVSRPYNLIEETKALAYARTFGESIVILDRKLTITRALRLIAQASYVCTINSSVGYEALLLGKQPLIMGDAIYDVGGHLKVSLSDIKNIDSIQHNKEHIRKLFNFFSGHFLIDKTTVASGKPIIEILQFLMAMNSRNISSESDVYWDEWVARFKFGINWMGILKAKSPSTVKLAEIFGNVDLLTAQKKNLSVEQDQVIISAKAGEEVISAGSARLIPAFYIGHIDDVLPSTTVKNGSIIRGWAIDEKVRQAAMILVIHDTNIIAIKHVIVPRQDTADFLRANLKNIGSKSVPSNCGFSIEVNIDSSKIQECSLALLSADNTISIYEVATGMLKPRR